MVWVALPRTFGLLFLVVSCEAWAAPDEERCVSPLRARPDFARFVRELRGKDRIDEQRAMDKLALKVQNAAPQDDDLVRELSLVLTGEGK